MLGNRLNLAALMAAATLGHGAAMPAGISLAAMPVFSPGSRHPRTGCGFAAVKRAAAKRRNVLRNRAMHRGSRGRRG